VRGITEGLAALDADALAFINAAGITDANQQFAINILVLDLKFFGLWTKMKAIYPFVGGTANSHKYNLKDPQDTNAAFRLVFNGGWTHSANGVLPNGTNSYADTFLIPSSDLLSSFSSHMSYYSKTNNDGLFIEMGSQDTSIITPIPRLVLHIKYSGIAYYDQNNQTTGRLSFSMSAINSDGLFLMTRIANNIQKGFRNGTQIGSTNTATMSSPLPNRSIYIGAYNVTPGIVYTNRQCAFASIGDGLNDTEAANYYTAVQAFQTTLGRQV